MIAEAKIPNYEFENSVEALTLTAAYTTTGEGGLFGAKRSRLGVTLEAHVCAACGFTEWFAQGLELLARFAREQLGGVTVESAE